MGVKIFPHGMWPLLVIFLGFSSKLLLYLKENVTEMKQNQVVTWHFLAATLYKTLKFPKFDRKLRAVWPHCAKVMLPVSKKI